MTRTNRPLLTIVTLAAAAGATAATLMGIGLLSQVEGAARVQVAAGTLPIERIVVVASELQDALPVERIEVSAKRLPREASVRAMLSLPEAAWQGVL